MRVGQDAGPAAKGSRKMVPLPRECGACLWGTQEDRRLARVIRAFGGGGGHSVSRPPDKGAVIHTEEPGSRA